MTLSVGEEDAPQAASALGFGGRFRYFHGESGRRYLFTAIDPDSLQDYRNAVVIASDQKSEMSAPIFLLGEVDRYGGRRGFGSSAKALKRMRIYVHLLASRAGDRREVLEDLRPALVCAREG